MWAFIYKNHSLGMHSDIVPLIIPKKNFRTERLKGLISYPLFITNSKERRKGKRMYRKFAKRLRRIEDESEKIDYFLNLR